MLEPDGNVATTRIAVPESRAWWLSGVSTTALVLATVTGIVTAQASLSVEQSLPNWLSAVALGGLVAIVGAAWLTGAQRPAISAGVAVMAAGLLLPVWAGFDWLPPSIQAAAAGAAPIAVAGVSAVALCWSSAGPRHRALLLVRLLTVAAVAVHVAGYDPLVDPGCLRTCREVDPLGAAWISSRSAVLAASILTVVASMLALRQLLRARAGDMPRGVRRAVMIALIVLAGAAVFRPLHWSDSPDATAVVLPSVIAGLVVGIATLSAAEATRRTREGIQSLARSLADPATALGPRDLIRTIEFAVPGEDRWVDAEGRPPPAEPPDGTPSLTLWDHGSPAIRLRLVSEGVRADLTDALTPGSLLALGTARLKAITSARLASVQSSRRRIVVTSDTERRRIERDLHDGAQQRLVSAAFHVQVARNRLGDAAPSLLGADTAVHEALLKLRRLAHGIFPAALTDEGLRTALEQLADEANVPVTLDVSDEALDAVAAAAAYATVVAAIEHEQRDGNQHPLHVSVRLVDEALLTRIEMRGAPGLDASSLSDLEDRVGAVGGRVSQARVDTGSVLSTVLPCASS